MTTVMILLESMPSAAYSSLSTKITMTCIIPDCYTSILPGSTDESLSLIQVTIDEVSKRLKALNIYKVTGPDKLPNVILKKCADALAPSLTTFINFGLRSGNGNGNALTLLRFIRNMIKIK